MSNVIQLHDDHQFWKIKDTISEEKAEELFREAGIEPFWREPPVLEVHERKLLYRISQDLVKVCTNVGIPIWMDGGTMLGAVRHGGLIPWDDDTDFSIFDFDHHKFDLLAIPQLRNMGYGVASWWFGGYKVWSNTEGDPVAANGLPFHVVPNVDVFRMIHDPKTDELMYHVVWPSGLTIKDLLPLKSYKFGPLDLPGPHKPDHYLDAVYGPDWPVAACRGYDNKSLSYPKMMLKVRLSHFPVALPE